MLMEISYSGKFVYDPFLEVYKSITFIAQPEYLNISSVANLGQESTGTIGDDFFEESNFLMLGDVKIFMLNSIIFMLQSLLLSQYVSDIMCGRNSTTTYIGLPFTFIGSNISYGLLFFCFSCCTDAIMYWNGISVIVGIITLLFIELQNRFICRCNIRNRVKRKIDPSLEAQEDVPIDQEAKRYLATRDHKGMVKKLASKYGTPFVGVHREIVKEIYQTTSEENENQFRLYAISGRRGTGKTRLVYECFKRQERMSEFMVLQGEAAVKDDDKSKDMDLEDQDSTGQMIKIQKCQPFEPIRKAIGNIVGINVFSSPSQQLSMIKNATDFAESFNGLSFLFSIDNKEEGGDENADDSKQMSDVHVLADSLSKILIKEAKRYHSEQGKKLVLLLEDMEYADKNSLDFLRVLIKIFSESYKSIPIVIVILYRELPGADPMENNEGKILEIVKIANKVAKETGGVKKITKLVNSFLGKKQRSIEEDRKIMLKRDESQGDAKEEKKEDCKVKELIKDAKAKIENKVEKIQKKGKSDVIAKHYQLKNLNEKNLNQLCNSLCFVDEEVSDVSKWLFTKTKGKLYWVSVCLQNLFMERFVESSMRGWKLAPGKSLREIAIPNKMAQALEAKFRKMDDHGLKILQIAAE